MIWKCASGGYHSGQSCQEEYKSFKAKFATATGNDLEDVQLVRVVERDELLNYIKEKNWMVDILPWHIDTVLDALLELTPSGTDKKSWDKIHGR